MVEIREAPVPVAGWFWPMGVTRKDFFASLSDGWPTDLRSAVMDSENLICTGEEQAMGLRLSNGQTVIVRAKK